MRARIAVVHSFPTWLPPTQRWMHTLVQSLPASIEAHVVCERTNHLDEFGVPNLHSSGTSWLSSLMPVRWRAARHRRFLERRLADVGARVLHSHFGDVGWHDRAAAVRTKTAHVVSFYGYDAGSLPELPLWHDRLRELFASAARILVEGPSMARRLETLGCPGSALRILHVPVPVDAFEFSPRVWNGAGPLRILVAATFREKKGIPLALEAVVRLRRELPVELTLVGDAGRDRGSQSEKQRITDAIQRHGFDTGLRRLGFLGHDALQSEAKSHHVFLAPSVTARNGDSEGGLPVTLVEMAALGLAIVTSRHADIPELIQHDVTGRLVEEGDVDAIVREVLWLAAHRDRWRDTVIAARRRAQEQFDAPQQGQRLAEIYGEL